MIEVGKSYIFKHCENDASEWNGKTVTVQPGGFNLLDDDGVTFVYHAIREDGLEGSVLEEELIELPE